MMPDPACFYFPLEPVASRYTHQLCNSNDGWMTMALREQKWGAFRYIVPLIDIAGDVKVGAVLDAVSRSRFAMAQCDIFLGMIARGEVHDGDVLYFQDFWTPGIEAIYYTLHMYGIKVRSYAMLHAQSVDPYDFTSSMTRWMRGIELGYAREMDGIFVASSIHKGELMAAGFYPNQIYVVGLPFGLDVMNRDYLTKKLPLSMKEKLVLFTSRLDLEKNPQFMVEVAKKFLAKHPDWRWMVTTSSSDLRSYNNKDGVDQVRGLNASEPRFLIATGLSKPHYYSLLANASIHFNSSLQDYVSWTLIESQFFGCTPVFPNFRSFPECLRHHPLYRTWDVDSAVDLLSAAVESPSCDESLPALMDFGRHMAAEIAFKGSHLVPDFNIWKGNYV